MTESTPIARPRIVQRVKLPALLYGTAWNEERTPALVETALGVEFRGIDTAGSRPPTARSGRRWRSGSAKAGCALRGVSSVSPGQLAALCARAASPPAFVQSRCFAGRGWDQEVRAVCREAGVVDQGLSLLTANRAELAGAEMRGLAAARGMTVPQLVFRFALGLGMVCRTGTTDARPMREDLAVQDFAPPVEASGS
jgi:diketogulonate reductase-like aldo/keto reductase